MYIHIDNDSKSDGTLNVGNTCVSGRMVCFMPIVEVRINGRENALALLDTGSSGTFCTKALTERLGITGIDEMYNLNTLSGRVPRVSETVKMSVASQTGKGIDMAGVFVVESIPAQITQIDVTQYDHLRYLDFPDFSKFKGVDLLIGQDYAEALIPLEVKTGNQKWSLCDSNHFWVVFKWPGSNKRCQ